MVSGSNFGMVKLGSDEFNEFRDYLQSISGIDLDDNKQYLVATRIRRVLIDYQCQSLSDLTQLIKRPANKGIRQKSR